MNRPRGLGLYTAALTLIAVGFVVFQVPSDRRVYAHDGHDSSPAVQNATIKIQQGTAIFRFDTFGDEAFWGDTLTCIRQSRS